MLTLEEVTAWTTAEILAEIRVRLPQGWKADCVWSDKLGFWTAQVLRPEDGNMLVEREETNMDERLAVLNIFGALWFDALPRPPADSPWVRRREVTREVVNRQAAQTAPPDPEDLDPQEIQELYQIHEDK